jgi:hypothetical protein
MERSGAGNPWSNWVPPGLAVPYEEAYEAGFEDMRRRAPDIGKIERLIGYPSALNLSEMLQGVIAYERRGNGPSLLRA